MAKPEYDRSDTSDLKKARRRNPANTDALKIDRLPPHSIEAEQGVLGAILVSGTLSTVEKVRHCLRSMPGGAETFYELKHRIIYETLVSMVAKMVAVDIITICECLKVKGQLEGVGGAEYISSLSDTVPSAENLNYYLGIIVDKWRAAKLLRMIADAKADILENEDKISEIERGLTSKLTKHLGTAVNKTTQTNTIMELHEYDTENDANCIIGFEGDPDLPVGQRSSWKTRRWGCKGASIIIVGPSGIGKSTLSVQAVIKIALAESFYGVLTRDKQRVLIVQAENDIGDTAEMLQGALRAMGYDPFKDEAIFEDLQNRVKFVTEREKVGNQWCEWLEGEIIAHGATVVYVDPLLSFCGCDLSFQKDASEFLRQYLNPVLAKTGVLLIVNHHTGKVSGMDLDAEISSTEASYKGAGSSELTNWARATLLIWPLKQEGHFCLIFSKRGKRAGATHPDGRTTDRIYLKHGDDYLRWEQTLPPKDMPTDDEGGSGGHRQPREQAKPKSIVQRICSSNLYAFFQGCEKDGSGDKGETETEIVERLENFLTSKQAEQRIAADFKQCKRAIKELTERGRIDKRGGRYFKGQD